MPRLCVTPQRTDLRVQLAARIRLAREMAGLSQDYVSQQIGLSRGALCQLEYGHRRIYADELITLARIYGKPLDWFVAPVMAWEGGLYA